MDSIMTATIMHDGANAYLDTHDAMPLGLLGLPLAESARNGIPDQKYMAVLDAVTVPPAADLGIRWEPRGRCGRPWPADALFSQRRRLLAWKLQTNPALFKLSLGQLLQHMPALAFPTTLHLWGFSGHFEQLLTHLASSDSAISAVRAAADQVQMPTVLLPLPVKQPTGDVQVSDVARFFAGHPLLARAMRRRLPWQGTGPTRHLDPTRANTTASAWLGIEVDLRLGSLVSAACVEEAINRASGERFYMCVPHQRTNLVKVVDDKVPEVRSQQVLDIAGAFGSAWSCKVDEVLNDHSNWKF
jgi:hypothetical protein